MGIVDRWITLFNKPIPNVILRLVVLFGWVSFPWPCLLR